MRLYEFILMEARATALAAKYEAKILARAKQDHSVNIADVVTFLEKLESEFGKSVEWALLKWLQGNFLIEDLPRVKQAIVAFEQKKRALEKKDINQYKTLLDLEDAVGLLDDVKSNRQKKQEIKTEGFKVIANTDQILLGQLLTEEAAKFYGKSTKWCTAGDEDNQFENYSSQGPLYFLLNKQTNEKFQIHYETGSCMDVYDKSYSYFELLKIAPELKTLDPGISKLDNYFLISYIKAFVGNDIGNRPDILQKVTSYPDIAYGYATQVIKGPWPPGEEAIAVNARNAFYYAKDVVKRPWTRGEEAIATSAEYAYCYAKYIIKRPWPPGEAAIATDSDFAYYYAKYIIKGPWPSGEAVIAKRANTAYDYAQDVIKGPWSPGEEAIKSDAGLWRDYCKHFKQ